MINSDQELEVVRSQVEQLQEAKNRAYQIVSATPFQKDVSAAGFQKMIDRMTEEIAEYRARKRSAEIPLEARPV